MTWYTYDILNRLSTVADPLQGLTRFTYDANGNLLTVTDPQGSTTTHEYDVSDRLSRRLDPLGESRDLRVWRPGAEPPGDARFTKAAS